MRSIIIVLNKSNLKEKIKKKSIFQSNLAKIARFDKGSLRYLWIFIFMSLHKDSETFMKKKEIQTQHNLNSDHHHTILLACREGNLTIIQSLLTLPTFDPSSHNNLAIRTACCNGHALIVSLLLTDPRVNSGACENEALRLACSNGHIEVVRLLLKDLNCDPTSNDNKALRVSAYTKNYDIHVLLLSDPRITPSLWKRYSYFIEILLYCILQYMCHTIELGSAFFIVALMYLMIRNTTKRVGGMSPYSIFNTNYETMNGTLTGNQLDDELRRKMY
jgi:hypothetical protein